MNSALPFSIILPVLILFSIDPDTSLVASDIIYKQNYRDIDASDDKLNKDRTKSQIQNDRYLVQNVNRIVYLLKALISMKVNKFN
jgi:hypothetical protein